MTVKNIYDEISTTNPKTLVEITVNSILKGKGLYNTLTRVNSSKKEGMVEPSKEDVEELNLLLFKIWSEGLNTYPEELLKKINYSDKIPMLLEIINNNNIDSFDKLRKKIKSLECRDKYGFINMIHLENLIHNTSLKDGYDKDYWYIVSDPIEAIERKRRDLKIYLNADHSIYYKFAKCFIEKAYYRNNSKFGLKFINYFNRDENMSQRDDGLVIYFNYDELNNCIEIMNEIKEEHPEFMEKIYEPQILAGKYDYYGIASEGKFSSYSNIKTNMIFDSILAASMLYYKSCLDIKTDDGTETLREKMIKSVIKSFRENEYVKKLLDEDDMDIESKLNDFIEKSLTHVYEMVKENNVLSTFDPEKPIFVVHFSDIYDFDGDYDEYDIDDYEEYCEECEEYDKKPVSFLEFLKLQYESSLEDHLLYELRILYGPYDEVHESNPDFDFDLNSNNSIEVSIYDIISNYLSDVIKLRKEEIIELATKIYDLQIIKKAFDTNKNCFWEDTLSKLEQVEKKNKTLKVKIDISNNQKEGE